MVSTNIDLSLYPYIVNTNLVHDLFNSHSLEKYLGEHLPEIKNNCRIFSRATGPYLFSEKLSIGFKNNQDAIIFKLKLDEGEI